MQHPHLVNVKNNTDINIYGDNHNDGTPYLRRAFFGAKELQYQHKANYCLLYAD